MRYIFDLKLNSSLQEVTLYAALVMAISFPEMHSSTHKTKTLQGAIISGLPNVISKCMVNAASNVGRMYDDLWMKSRAKVINRRLRSRRHQHDSSPMKSSSSFGQGTMKNAVHNEKESISNKLHPFCASKSLKRLYQCNT